MVSLLKLAETHKHNRSIEAVATMETFVRFLELVTLITELYRVVSRPQLLKFVSRKFAVTPNLDQLSPQSTKFFQAPESYPIWTVHVYDMAAAL